ncbi:TPA: hypothetical protein N0F65_012694 [Lagenidium giganteum]|uniref:Uncharacterized protein n=1 Tax=Lagenidium giganteum TaxID=4803 RepID=A0AAV2YHC0_9STRA|nr:TPA: hypothetical protein N0F65_012694 [Lagenidium giganteum]
MAMAHMSFKEREELEERRRRLVGSFLAANGKESHIEQTFAHSFGRWLKHQAFWDAFDQACENTMLGQPWQIPRQMMISFSLPQEVNGQDERGETMLTLAAAHGREKVVNILCQIKASPYAENSKGWSAVHNAAVYGRTSVLQVFITLGIDIDRPDGKLHYTPAHLAASVDNVEMLRFLHSTHLVDFSKTSVNGSNVLHVAAASGADKCVAFLLSACPDLKFQADHVLHENPAHKAAKHCHPLVYSQLRTGGARLEFENVEVTVLSSHLLTTLPTTSSITTLTIAIECDVLNYFHISILFDSFQDTSRRTMNELTKRKGVSAVDVQLEDSASSKCDGVRAIEYDIRPSCANEPPLRYISEGERLVLTDAKAGVVVADNALGRCVQCLSWNFFVRELKEMFLPAGYPDSVSEDYLTFQFWDTIQAMCSYLRGVLATQSVLQSVGVGDDKATPLAAALQWVLRDGSGMIGGLTFAYIVGPKFDMNVKRWRLFADVINDVGLTLDMLAPYFPSLVTEVLCVSSVCKTMCGVAAGSTRSSLMTHFAKRDNMADCSAKEGSQETAVKLFGLLFGMYFANAVNSSRSSVWVAFIFLTLVHVYANYNAVSGLCIPTLNRQRAGILIERFLQRSKSTATMSPSKDIVDASTRFSVRSVNQEEPIFSNPKLEIFKIIMGSQLYKAVPSNQDLDQLLRLYRDETYLLSLLDGHVHVVFRAETKPTDELRAFFQAVLVLKACNGSGPAPGPEVLATTYHQMTSEFAYFFQCIQNSGWRTHMFLLNTSQWRIKLNDSS